MFFFFDRPLEHVLLIVQRGGGEGETDRKTDRQTEKYCSLFVIQVMHAHTESYLFSDGAVLYLS